MRLHHSPEVVEREGDSHVAQSGADSSPASLQVEPESGGDQGDLAAGGTIGAFSGFFSGFASAVEQRVS